MTLESLARTIAKACYGTEAHWAAMMPAARAVIQDFRSMPDEVLRVGAANIGPWWSRGMAGSEDYGNTLKAAKSCLHGMLDAIAQPSGTH